MRDNDEVIAEIIYLIVAGSIKLHQLSELIETAQVPAEVFKGIAEYYSIEDTIFSSEESEAVAFISKFSNFINLNHVDENGLTPLHVIAKKGSIILAETICNPDLEFAEKPTYFSTDNTGKRPIDLATDSLKPLFSRAMQNELIRRIILVHPLQPNSVLDLMYKLNKEHLVAFDNEKNEYDLATTVVNAVIKDDTILTDDATIGSHLAFDTHQYTNTFIDRPHVHWWWNGLFQANSGGDWEHSRVAFLEPLTSMDNVMGCAPYDTMTMGSHTFTKNSCLLVPYDCVDLLKARLKNFQGKIVGFNPLQETLRNAINRILQENYPHAAQLISKDGKDINQTPLSGGDRDFNYSLAHENGYNCNTGYFQHLSLRIEGEPSFPLMQNENELLMPEFQNYAQGRFVGLHSHSPTDVESNRLINILKDVSCNPCIIKEHPGQFVSKGQDLGRLCVIEAFHIYKKLTTFSPVTGMHDYATYLLKKALTADLLSVSSNLGCPVNFNGIIAKRIIETNYEQLFNSIEILVNTHKLPEDGEFKSYKIQQLNEYRKYLSNLIKQSLLYSDNDQVFYSSTSADFSPESSIDNTLHY